MHYKIILVIIAAIFIIFINYLIYNKKRNCLKKEIRYQYVDQVNDKLVDVPSPVLTDLYEQMFNGKSGFISSLYADAGDRNIIPDKEWNEYWITQQSF